MISHFGIRLKKSESELRVTSDNYIRECDKVLSESFEEVKLKIERALEIFDLNIKYFRSLSSKDFNITLESFLDRNNFYEVKTLDEAEFIQGHYIMVLDDYNQVYVGTSTLGEAIKRRVPQHWRKHVKLEGLNLEYSCSLSIANFKALDTTRIYIKPDNENKFFKDYTLNELYESELVAQLPVRYCLNSSMINFPKKLFHERLRERDLRDLSVYGDKFPYPLLPDGSIDRAKLKKRNL